MAAELYAKATDAFFDEDYDEALELYSKALDQEPNNAEFLLRRYCDLSSQFLQRRANDWSRIDAPRTKSWNDTTKP